MKILNLFSGAGGNRALWGDSHEITAVEINETIANAYADMFPGDKVIITDAMKYLIDHYSEFDFIWASPPCPDNSRAKFSTAGYGSKINAYFPDLRLYQIIIFLKKWYKGYYLVENVIPYYDVLIPPAAKIGRSLFWCNFKIPNGPRSMSSQLTPNQKDWKSKFNFDLKKYQFDIRKDKVYKNMINPDLGLHILSSVPENFSHKIEQKIINF